MSSVRKSCYFRFPLAPPTKKSHQLICPSSLRFLQHIKIFLQLHCSYLEGCAKQPSKYLNCLIIDIITSQLIATLHQAQAAATRVSAPVKIERFDNLSTWDIFQVPRLVEVVGSDHIAQMNVVLPVTCVGPLDAVTILVNIAPNPDWPSKARKIRVNKIQVPSQIQKSPHLLRPPLKKSSLSNPRPEMS